MYLTTSFLFVSSVSVRPDKQVVTKPSAFFLAAFKAVIHTHTFEYIMTFMDRKHFKSQIDKVEVGNI